MATVQTAPQRSSRFAQVQLFCGLCRGSTEYKGKTQDGSLAIFACKRSDCGLPVIYPSEKLERLLR